MATPNQLTGGLFQDALGNPLANGYLELQLSQDSVTSDNKQVAAGHVIRIDLDSDGSVSTSPEQFVWANDALVPANTFYNVSAFSAQGQLVWGPNSQQVLSSPSPFNVGAWVPGTVNIFAQSIVLVTGVSQSFSGSTVLPLAGEIINVNVPGAIAGSPVVVSPTNNTFQPIGILVDAMVYTNGYVSIRRYNVTDADINTITATYNIIVIL